MERTVRGCRASTSRGAWSQVKRLSTGLPDLDLVLGGGLEAGSVVVVAGPPGTGKTILAQQICFANASPEHKAIYYTTLSESHSKLVEHLADFAFFDSTFLGPRIEHIHLGDLLRDERREGLASLVNEVVRKALEVQPVVVVIDSAKMLRDFVTESELRMALYDMTSRVTHTGTVLLMLGEYTPEEMRGSVEFSLADGIVQLSYEPREPVDRRWLRVVKMRGGAHREGKHTFHIDGNGVEVFPRIETLLPLDAVPSSGRIASGIEGLDALMGGGMPQGDANLVLGPSGAGKSIFSLGYVAEGLSEQKRCLYITFQDTTDQLLEMASGFGWDFGAALKSGQLTISHVPLGSLDLDVLASVVRQQLASREVSRVVIDSLAEMGSAAREAERFPAYLRSIVGLVRASGASLLVTSETATVGPPSVAPLSGLMFLFHNVIQLRYVERRGEVGRALNIIKMRRSMHATGVHACRISDHGLAIGERLEGVTGILGWSVLREVQPV
jgi:circadian clock protein KaiC